nr:LysR family transcriptional regulator [uncultured Tolumonas sp.]
MDLKRLRYFCTVAEQGSITKASELLHIAQPALSKRLSELEEELGTKLLTRNGREMQLTEAGAFLYQRACLILRNVADVCRETILFANNERKILKIGVSYLYENYFTPLLADLQKSNPNLELRISVSDSSHLEFLLTQGMLDVILVQTPKNTEGYNITHLAPIKLSAVVSKSLLPAEHPTSLSFTQIANFPLVSLHRIGGTGIFEYLIDQIRKQGIHPNVIMHVSQPRMLLQLLESGIEGAAFLPESEIIPNALSHCHVINIHPNISIFHPAIVNLSSGVALDEITEMLKHQTSSLR